MARHGALLAALFVQPHHPSRAARPEVLDPHLQPRGNAASPRLDPAILAKIPSQASDWRVMRAESQVRT